MDIESVFEADSELYVYFLNEIEELKRVDKGFSRSYHQGLEKWRQIFKNLYDISKLDEELYSKHSFLVIVSRYLVKLHVGKALEEIKTSTIIEFLSAFEWLSLLSKLEPSIVSTLVKVHLQKRDIFYKLYPRMIPHSTKHGSGEYYTPYSLASLMVEELFKPGMLALDPSCGSGTFLIEMVKAILVSDLSVKEKKEAVNDLEGFDKNILALFMSTINLELLLDASNLEGSFPNLMLSDSLFPSDPSPSKGHYYDLIIGNPPWIVLGGVDNLSYKEKLKNLAIELEIYMGGKNASNLEISVLFLFQFVKKLKPEGWIFFILPNSIITGSQHDRARVFSGFKRINVWKFSSQPFKIHSVCLMGQKSLNGDSLNYKVPFYLIESRINGDSESFTKKSSKIYEPFDIELDSKDKLVTSVKRFIPQEKKKKLLKLGRSPYDELFYKGAQIFPRTIFFVDMLNRQEDDDQVIEIKPSKKVSPKKLGRWNFLPYKKSKIEKDYVFSIAKSTSLIPFTVLGYLDAFLPYKIEVKDGVKQLVEDESLKKNAQAHFNLVEGVFRQNKKPGASHSSLLEIINYQGCLSNPRQMAPLKVVYNGGGSIVKGALVENDNIVDYSMFYCPVESKTEAYYLIGYLNAPVLTESVKLVGSTGYHGSLRNIVKHPWDFPWPIYSPRNAMHLELSEMSQGLETKITSMVQKKLNLAKGVLPVEKGISRISVQNEIMNDEHIKEMLSKIDELVVQILNEE